MKRVLMEFLGTFFFVFTIAMTGNPWAIGAMLMAWVYIGGYISGAHYNPAVSLAVALRGKLSMNALPHYMLAQLLGSFVAYGLAVFLRGNLIQFPDPAPYMSLLQPFALELLLAFVLAYVVLSVATVEKFRASQIFGFAIGFTFPALAILGKPVSGGVFNPAIALGATLWQLISKSSTIIWPHVVMYVAAPLIGGALAAYVFKYFTETYLTESKPYYTDKKSKYNDSI